MLDARPERQGVMEHITRVREYGELKQEIGTEEYRALLERLKSEDPFMRQFEGWHDVVRFMRMGRSRNHGKEGILRAILHAHGRDKDPRWRTILLVIFWPGLESIHTHKRGWDSDPEDFWQNILWTFLQVVLRIDLTRRSDRLVQKLINDTVHRLADKYRAKWKYSHMEIEVEEREIEEKAPRIGGVDFDAIELREIREAEIKRLRAHLNAGRITEPDFLLLVGTKVYGQSIADYARERGLSYQMLRKRRYRAEAEIKRMEGLGK